MSSTLKLAKSLNEAFPDIVPEYQVPRWWEFRRKSMIRWMDKYGLKYELVDKNGRVVGGSK